MERVTGLEPALSAWEADVLPLNYTRAMPGQCIGRWFGGSIGTVRGAGVAREVAVRAGTAAGAVLLLGVV